MTESLDQYSVCLRMAPAKNTTAPIPPTPNRLLKEDGFHLLTETGAFIDLEQ